MQLAINEDRRWQKLDEGLDVKCEGKCGSDDWARWYHQWQSRMNQGSTQVNLTGSLLGHVLVFIHCTRARMGQAMLSLSSNGKRGAG